MIALVTLPRDLFSFTLGSTLAQAQLCVWSFFNEVGFSFTSRTSNPSVRRGLSGSRISNLQIVSYRKYPRHLIRCHFRHRVVRLAIDYTFQRHMSVVHDNMDRWNGSHRIFEEPILAVDRSRNLSSDLVVIGRRRQNFDLVVNLVDPFNSFHGTFGVSFKCGIHDAAEQRHSAAVHRIFKIIENRVIRQHQQLMSDFPSDPLLASIVARWTDRQLRI